MHASTVANRATLLRIVPTTLKKKKKKKQVAAVVVATRTMLASATQRRIRMEVSFVRLGQKNQSPNQRSYESPAQWFVDDVEETIMTSRLVMRKHWLLVFLPQNRAAKKEKRKKKVESMPAFVAEDPDIGKVTAMQRLTLKDDQYKSGLNC
jgi:hypothetical protein